MKHASQIVMIALLYNSAAYPIPSLNLGKELIQKGTGWVANTVPGWSYFWAGLAVLCAVQWQRFHNKWRASEEKYATFERQVKAQSESNSYLVLFPKKGQNLCVKYAADKTQPTILWVKDNIIQVSRAFLNLIGTDPLVKIFDEDMNIIVDNTVKMGGSQISKQN